MKPLMLAPELISIRACISLYSSCLANIDKNNSQQKLSLHSGYFFHSHEGKDVPFLSAAKSPIAT